MKCLNICINKLKHCKFKIYHNNQPLASPKRVSPENHAWHKDKPLADHLLRSHTPELEGLGRVSVLPFQQRILCSMLLHSLNHRKKKKHWCSLSHMFKIAPMSVNTNQRPLITECCQTPKRRIYTNFLIKV